MKTDNELISIIIPVYNGERFFDEAIASIQAQTYRHWEVIFIDDGSTDSSVEKAQKYCAAQPSQFKLFRHPKGENLGVSQSRNVGLEQADGKFIAFLDIDDIWLPEKLARQSAILREKPEVAMVYGPLHFWYGWTGKQQDSRRDFYCHHFPETDVMIPPIEAVIRLVNTHAGLPAPSSTCMNRRVIDDGIRFDTEFIIYEDEAFYSRVALAYPVFYMSDCLERYRQHPNSACARAIAEGIYKMGEANSTRRKFLQWLKDYICSEQLATDRLLLAIEQALNDQE